MKIRSVKINNRKQAFEVGTWREPYLFPFSKACPPPVVEDPVVDVFIDEELGREAFTYKLESGKEGSVHIDHVLEYNQDPAYLRNLLLYKLTIEAQKRIEASGLSKREIIRRLGTSPAQFYRLVDSTNYRKSVDKVLSLLHVLDCDVDLIVRDKSA
ncbi:MAG: helix-turn-helix domain-containing protein [Candidatus Eisenbacteria bacterium]|uniref:Helix-turn-helix domain-containing protein n=1 Tax=Eiseniibacteriota bacterium TaxID=2212470 RepID=A0A948RV06_UNCEI|nr:helix-turn-helix domain-containing protein [Candidatus Eisenbacteria bacterium]MBU1948140.1 helix-turn-helix domain-containing protein [Candidatus Eisenbacteria bacterium]MBU2689957.1 helix-turn-helix domain-containing protein [Candidatus Eisenbacteria bacterium]